MRSTITRAALGALCVGAAASPSCTKPPPPGEVMMVVHTDMSLPKDVDSVLIEVLVRGDQRFKQQFEKLGADESLKIPASLGITIAADSDPTTPVTLRITASQAGRVRVLNEAVTTVPPDRVATLRMPIHWLCWDQVDTDATGNAVSLCEEGQTCVAGSCVDKKIDPAKLPDYSPGDIFGGGTGKGDGKCFDVSSCFTGSVDAPVDMASCTIAASGEVNVGIRVESAGICGPAGCFVVLDGKTDAGWQPGSAGGTIQLPTAVCDRITSGLAAGVSVAGVSSACPLKTNGLPACGPWSSAGSPPPTPGQSEPVSVVANQDRPTSLVVADGNVYWTSSGPSDKATGSVKRASIAGGPVTALALAQAFPKDLALDLSPNGKVNGVYWATNGVGSMGAIAGVDVTAPASPKPVSLPTITGVISPEGIAVQGGVLFFTDFGGNAVYSVDLTTKMPSLIAGPANSAPQTGAYRVHADSARIFWTNEAMPGQVMMADRGDPLPVQIAGMQGTPRDLALDGAPAVAIFWTNYTSGEVMTATINAGAPPTAGAPQALFTGQNKPYGIVVDGASLYWTNDGDGTVMKAPKAGGTPVVIAKGQASPGAVAVDGDNVYWINQGSFTKADGAIMKLAKKP